MKLSDLVYYRNTLDSIDIEQVKQTALGELAHVKYLVAETGVDLHSFADEVKQKYSAAVNSIQDLSQILVDLKQDIDLRIENRQDEYFAASSRLYHYDMCFETTDYILGRRLAIDNESLTILESRLKMVTDWRTPGMIIRPAKDRFIENLVPMDPLYLVDHSQDLLDPTLNQFNDVYRARLRPYVVNEQQQQILQALPDNQFALIFAYNFFNYKPFEIIQRWMQEIAAKLRPGGKVLFTFNDCDRGHGVALAERNLMCYTPKTKLIRSIENFGLDLSHQHTGLGDLSWLEFQKPGEIVSLRGSQPLAKIVRK